MAQKNNRIYDYLLLLEDATTTAKTATGQSTAISFKPGLNTVFLAQVDITSMDETDTDETYVISIEISADNSTFYEVGKTICKSSGSYATGVYPIAISGEFCEKVIPSAAYVRVVWTLAGTTPSLKFIAHLAIAQA